MRIIACQITLLLLLSSLFGFSNNEKDTLPVLNSKAVKHAIQLKKSGKIEESINVGLLVLSSKTELSLKDSLRISRVLAANLRSIGDHEQALKFARIWASLDQKIHSRSELNLSILINYFNAFEQYDSTIYYLKKAKEQLIQKGDNHYGLAKNHNNIGFTYYLAGQLDSAELYYKKAASLQPQNKNFRDIVGLASGNLGQLYFLKKDYKNALIYMEIDAKLTKDRIKDSYKKAIIGIAESHFMLGNQQAAKNTLKLYFKQKKN